LRNIMWLPDKQGLLGMMPGYATDPAVMGIKTITVFFGNRDLGLPSHQGVVILFDAKQGQPLMIFDALEITAIRTAAASALATKLLSKENSETMAIIGSGEQAERHLESILLVRKIKTVNVWSKTEKKAIAFVEKNNNKYSAVISVSTSAEQAVKNADIICTVTSASEPVVKGEWLKPGAHVNAVGSSTASKRELDSEAILRGKLFTDCYESIFNEAGDFLIPKKQGLIGDDHVKADLGEVLTGMKKGREGDEEITIFKSLGIASEDIFSAYHIYKKLQADS
jgi:alanine dehydrogenase